MLALRHGGRGGSDSCWRYGTVGADFGAATYDYSLMPWKLSDSSSAAEVEAVATLLFHCGVACDMRYNSDCQGSSGASIQNCLSGMKHFFHYNMESYQAFRYNYSDAVWDNMIKADLAAGRPVYYAGQSYRDDDEGTVAQDVTLIQNGILTGYMNDRETAEEYGMTPTGNARGWTFADEPIIRMRNTCILPGKNTVDELIASVDTALDGAISRLRKDYPDLTESDMQFAILSIIGASDSDMGILLNVQKQTIYHRRQIVRKHVNPEIEDIDAWLRKYVLSGFGSN